MLTRARWVGLSASWVGGAGLGWGWGGGGEGGWGRAWAKPFKLSSAHLGQLEMDGEELGHLRVYMQCVFI